VGGKECNDVAVTKMLRVAGATATLLSPSSMGSESLTETQHLEPWIIGNPGTIDPTLKIVTTR
jgi:hypothetical protein